MTIERITVGQAMARTLREGSGLKCPLGCRGCSARVFGLQKHLQVKHGYSKKKAKRIALREAGLS